MVTQLNTKCVRSKEGFKWTKSCNESKKKKKYIFVNNFRFTVKTTVRLPINIRIYAAKKCYTCILLKKTFEIKLAMFSFSLSLFFLFVITFELLRLPFWLTYLTLKHWLSYIFVLQMTRFRTQSCHVCNTWELHVFIELTLERRN